MSSNYFVNVFGSDPKVATIKFFDGLDYDYLLNEGVTLGIGNDYPEDAIFQIHEDSGNIITDFINNLDHCILINSKVRKYFADEGLDETFIEYLPFKLLNKKGKLVSKENYYIANVLPKVNCLDLDASKFDLHPKKKTVWKIHEIVIESKKVPPEMKIFRLGEDPKRIILRSDFVDGINSKGFSGLTLCEMGQELP